MKLKLSVSSIIRKLGASPDPSDSRPNHSQSREAASPEDLARHAQDEAVLSSSEYDRDGSEEDDIGSELLDDAEIKQTSAKEEGASERNPIRRQMSYQEAASIIGGVSIDDNFEHPSSAVHHQGSLKDEEEDTRNGRKVFGFSLPFSDPVFSLNNTRRLLSPSRVKEFAQEPGVIGSSVNKFFSAGESLADSGINTVRSLGGQIMSLRDRSDSSDDKSSSNFGLFKRPGAPSEQWDSEKTAGLTLEDLARFTTAQEDDMYRGVKQQDNGRLRAILQTIRRRTTLSGIEAEFPQIEGNVVIMGGFRGSILRDTVTGRRVWLPLKVGFKIRKIDLKVGITDQDEYDMEKKIHPDGMLKNIGPVDVARKLIQKLESQPKCKVHEFSYDWRLSSDINSDKLYKLLKVLYDNDKSKKGTIIICHSMGGLIAHHAMQKDPRLVRGMLYVGSPSSCPNILGPFRYGENVMFADKILTTKTTFLMRSAYSFLPLDGECFVDNDDMSKHYDLDFFDVNTWTDYHLSPCVDKDPAVRATQTNGDTDDTPLTYEAAREYLDRTLKRTKKFLEELSFDPEKANLYPPMSVLYGCSIPTLRHAKARGREGIKDGDYENLRFGNGDGVIYHKRLMPHCRDDRYQVCAKVPSRMGHISLMTDIEGVARGLNAILNEEKKGLRRLKSPSKAGSSNDAKLANSEGNLTLMDSSSDSSAQSKNSFKSDSDSKELSSSSSKSDREEADKVSLKMNSMTMADSASPLPLANELSS